MVITQIIPHEMGLKSPPLSILREISTNQTRTHPKDFGGLKPIFVMATLCSFNIAMEHCRFIDDLFNSLTVCFAHILDGKNQDSYKHCDIP